MSYYQLEKEMGIPRKTIQYRHEKIGIPLEDVPNFVPSSPSERLGISSANKIDRKDDNTKNIDQEIVLYPEAPHFDFESSSDETKEKLKLYIIWFREAPTVLLLREKQIIKTRLNNSAFKEITSLKKHLAIIEKVIKIRGLD